MNNDVIKEQLSALLDDELPATERALLLQRLAQDNELRDQFARYQLIQDAIGKHLPSQVDMDLSARIQSALQHDTSYAASVSKPVSFTSRTVKTLSGLAIAASVAVISVLGAQRLFLVTDDAKIDNLKNDSLLIAKQYRKTDGMRWTQIRNEVGNRLNGYLVNHREMTSSTSIQGMMNYVRIAGYDIITEERKKRK